MPPVYYGSKRNFSESAIHNQEENPTIPHLAKFLVAKKIVNNIFQDTETLLKDEYDFYKNNTVDSTAECKIFEQLEEITTSINRIIIIRQILTRDTMKIAFFGRTSNGKSSVINAILGDSILPSGIGHTTSCFLSMKGCSDSEPFVIAPESPEKLAISDLRQLARACSASTLGPNNLINVYWPIDRCPILGHQVSFLDSPGIDVDYDLDVWVNKYCRDADVFVLVVNSESTLNYSEKKFFHEVNKHISSPNIFILNNRWDASAYESDIEEIKDQHLKRCVDFLSKELECVTHDEAIERVYFISAQEALHSKLKMSEKQNISQDITNRFENTPGYHERVSEFLKFEEKLQVSLYRSAISTKFTSHCSQAESILLSMIRRLDLVLQASNNKKQQIENNLHLLNERKQWIISKTASVFDQFQKEIHDLSKNTTHKFYSLLTEELIKFPEIVKSFEYPFNSDPVFVDIYLRELIVHVTKNFENKIFQHTSNDVTPHVVKLENKIRDFVKDIFHDEKEQKLLSSLSCDTNINWYNDFDLTTICSNFQYDVSFKFFFNPISLIKWFASKIRLPIVENHSNTADNSVRLEDLNDSNINHGVLLSELRLQEQSSPIIENNPQVRQSIDDLSTTITTSTCVLMLVATKLVGYRIILLTSSVMVSVFGIKWLMWTNSAKRDSLIQQFLFYSENQIKLTFKMISHQNGKVVEKTLSSFLHNVMNIINSFLKEIDQEIKNNQSEIAQIAQQIENNSIMRHKCREIMSRLTSFCIQYELNIKKPDTTL